MKYFISRHPGAIEWSAHQKLAIDKHLPHIKIDSIKAEDKVYGTLPIQMAARICEIGADYYHLSLDLPVNLRGTELSATDMVVCNARLEQYQVKKVNS